LADFVIISIYQYNRIPETIKIGNMRAIKGIIHGNKKSVFANNPPLRYDLRKPLFINMERMNMERNDAHELDPEAV
jgi:hypothetical protein